MLEKDSSRKKWNIDARERHSGSYDTRYFVQSDYNRPNNSERVKCYILFLKRQLRSHLLEGISWYHESIYINIDSRITGWSRRYHLHRISAGINSALQLAKRGTQPRKPRHAVCRWCPIFNARDTTAIPWSPSSPSYISPRHHRIRITWNYSPSSPLPPSYRGVVISQPTSLRASLSLRPPLSSLIDTETSNRSTNPFDKNSGWITTNLSKSKSRQFDSAGSIESRQRRFADSPRKKKKKGRGGGGGISANITRHQEMPGARKIVSTISWKKKTRHTQQKRVKKKREKMAESLSFEVTSRSFLVIIILAPWVEIIR